MAITIDVNVGDVIMGGRFKNKPIKVKSIGKDEHGMPTINGRKATTFRIHKTVNIFDKPVSEKISRDGRGTFTYISNTSQVSSKVEKLFKKIEYITICPWVFITQTRIRYMVI